MPMIKITTDRRPWAAGQPRNKGDEVELNDDEAAVLVANGFAEMLTPAKAEAAPRRRRAAADDEAL